MKAIGDGWSDCGKYFRESGKTYIRKDDHAAMVDKVVRAMRPVLPPGRLTGNAELSPGSVWTLWLTDHAKHLAGVTVSEAVLHDAAVRLGYPARWSSGGVSYCVNRTAYERLGKEMEGTDG